MEEKVNCWGFMKCGREPGGINEERLGICPASIAIKYDGYNDGTCAGRFCWPVAGTFCNGQIQGTFAAKLKDCLKCPFLILVAQQEGESIVFMKYGIDARNSKIHSGREEL